MSDFFKAIASNPLFFLFFLWLCWPKKDHGYRTLNLAIVFVTIPIYMYSYISNNYPIQLSVYFLLPLIQMCLGGERRSKF